AAPRPMVQLQYRRAPTAITYRLISNALAWASRRMTAWGTGFGSGTVRPGILASANGLGLTAVYGAQTDRDYGRPIPSTIWNDVPPRARALLRFATIERSSPTAAYKEQRSARESARVLAHLATNAIASAASAMGSKSRGS